MDDLKTVRDTLTGERSDDTTAQAGARARLLELARTERRAHRVRRLPGRRIAVLAGAAAVAVATAGVVQFTRAPETRPAAGTFLLAAAQHAAAEKTGRYWTMRTTAHRLYRVGPRTAPYTIDYRQRDAYWFARDARDPSRWSSPRATAAPVSSADRTAWRRDGGPARWRLPGGDHLDARPRAAEVLPWDEGTSVFSIDDHGFGVRALRALPTDPRALKTKLLGYHTADRRAYGLDPDLPGDRTGWLYGQLSSLLATPAPPDVRAAAYRVLATLPGVALRGNDSEDRAIGRVESDPGLGGESVDHRLVIDRATGRLLADQRIVVRPGGETPWAARGTMVAWTDYRMSWTAQGPPPVRRLPG